MERRCVLLETPERAGKGTDSIMAIEQMNKSDFKKSKSQDSHEQSNTDIGKSDPKRLKALDSTLSGIEKQFGKGSVVRLGQSMRLNVDAISTGSIRFHRLSGGNSFATSFNSRTKARS